MKIALAALIVSAAASPVKAAPIRELKGGIPIVIPGSGSCGSVQDYVGKWLSDFTLGGVEPIGYSCKASTCQLDLLENEGDEEPSDNISLPCTQCDFEYPEEAVNGCFNAPCDLFTCNVLQETGSNQTSVDRNELPPETVEVCYELTRSDYFNVLHEGDSCILTNEMRKRGEVYKTGVTNVGRMDLLYHDEQAPGESESSVFEACQFLIDNEKCNSCERCGSFDAGIFEADCTNFAEGAVATCDSAVDPFIAIGSAIKVLEEGYVAPEIETSESAVIKSLAAVISVVVSTIFLS